MVGTRPEAGASEAERIGLVLAGGDGCRQRRHGPGFIEPDEGVVLTGKRRSAVVAPAFGLGPIDDADVALEPRLGQDATQIVMPAGPQV